MKNTVVEGLMDAGSLTVKHFDTEFVNILRPFFSSAKYHYMSKFNILKTSVYWNRFWSIKSLADSNHQRLLYEISIAQLHVYNLE